MSEAWTDRLRRQLDFAAPRMEAWGTIGKAYLAGHEAGQQSVKPMGKLSEAANRIKETKAYLEGEADKLLARVDEVRAKAPETFQRGHTLLDQHSSDLAEMESELRQLSNSVDAA